MENLKFRKRDHLLIVGDSPQLVIDLNRGEHYILMGKIRIPYRKEIRFSPDLLRGERENVMRTALEFYYGQACDIAEGYELAAAYRKKANLQIRELPGKKGANL